MRDHLVFVRAGTHSLHLKTLDEDPQRNWDCCVNTWADPSPTDGHGRLLDGAEHHVHGAINKFEAFAQLFEPLAAARRYRYIALIDDDLAFAPGALSRLFALCERHALQVAQPAIALGSHANHTVNLHNPACAIRQVNFVEVMAPCFSRAALDSVLPTFKLTRCTWGTDYAWSSLLAGQGLMSIVDAVTMQHTKPMDVAGGPFYERLRQLGTDPHQELQQVYARFAPWGPMRSAPTGHVYRWPLAERVNRSLMAWVERRKLKMHLARGGSLAKQTPPPTAASAATGDGRYGQQPRPAISGASAG